MNTPLSASSASKTPTPEQYNRQAISSKNAKCDAEFLALMEYCHQFEDQPITLRASLFSECYSSCLKDAVSKQRLCKEIARTGVVTKNTLMNAQPTNYFERCSQQDDQAIGTIFMFLAIMSCIPLLKKIIHRQATHAHRA